MRFSRSGPGAGDGERSVCEAIHSSRHLTGFTAGRGYELQPTVAVATDGTPGSKYQGCVTAGLLMGSDRGLGWTGPTFALSVITKVLGAFGAKPIGAFGGLRLGPKTLWSPGQGSEGSPGNAAARPLTRRRKRTPSITGGGGIRRDFTALE
jgi:hypothetical protein